MKQTPSDLASEAPTNEDFELISQTHRKINDLFYYSQTKAAIVLFDCLVALCANPCEGGYIAVKERLSECAMHKSVQDINVFKNAFNEMAMLELKDKDITARFNIVRNSFDWDFPGTVTKLVTAWKSDEWVATTENQNSLEKELKSLGVEAHPSLICNVLVREVLSSLVGVITTMEKKYDERGEDFNETLKEKAGLVVKANENELKARAYLDEIDSLKEQIKVLKEQKESLRLRLERIISGGSSTSPGTISTPPPSDEPV